MKATLNLPYTNTRYDIGDLVKVKNLYHLDYLEEQVGIIVQHFGADPSDPHGEYFYDIKLGSVTDSMILKHSELILVRKAGKK